MSRMLQVRNVPDDLHAVLQQRARQDGMTLSEFVLRQLQVVASRPPKAEVLARAARRGGSLTFSDAVDDLGEERRSRS